MTVRTGFNSGDARGGVHEPGRRGNYTVDAEGRVKISMPLQTAAVLTLPRDMHEKRGLSQSAVAPDKRGVERRCS